MWSSGMWRCINPGLTDVSEERIVSIFRVDKSASGEPASGGGCKRSSKKSVNSGSTQHHIPEDDILQAINWLIYFNIAKLNPDKGLYILKYFSTCSQQYFRNKEAAQSLGTRVWQSSTGFPQRWAPSSYVRFVVEKVTLEQVSSEYFVFPCLSLFHQIIHLHKHLGQVQ
jgi:hypothetical protein